MNHSLSFLIAMIVAVGSLLPVQLTAQNEAESVLLFTHQRKQKTKFIKADTKVIYKLKGSDEKRKGWLQQIRDSSVVISGKEYRTDEFSMMAGKSQGLKAVKILGVVGMVTGAGTSAMGGLLIHEGQNNTSNCLGSFFLVLLGVIFVAGGAVLVLIGMIPLFFRAKRFDLEEDWNMQISEVVPRNKRSN